jgi:hypothetical protein
LDHLVQVNDFLKGYKGPKPTLAALVSTLKGELGDARPANILWLSDPTRSVHRSLGLGRTKWAVFFQPGVIWGYLRAILRGVLPKKSAKGEDLLQLGGDFLWDKDGILVWSYPSKDPADRPTTNKIAKVLESYLDKMQ